MFELVQANRTDIKDIVAIAEQHYYTFGKNGFLISNYDYDRVSNILSNPNSVIYLTKKDGVTVSFLILTKIYHTLEMNNLSIDLYEYNDLSDKDLIQNFNHWHMEQGAVAKDHLNSGVGSFYYQALFDKYNDFSFSSNVVEKPFKNVASINIKKKFNFREAGYFYEAKYKGLDDFKMIMFIRQPQNEM